MQIKQKNKNPINLIMEHKYKSKVMNNKLLLVLFSLFFSQTIRGQILDTTTICHGDSVFLYNTWEAQTGNYTNGFDITTLIVNPTTTKTRVFLFKN